MDNNIILEMKNITKSFPGVNALKNVNFNLSSGEVHALLGENGAGKSTLMKVLTGVYQKDSGKIYLYGKERDIANPKEAQNYGISIIYQEFNLLPHLTVAENIFIGREPANKKLSFLIDDSKLNNDALKIMKTLNLNIKPNEIVKNLSVAKQQMVEIAKALSFNSKILIMDEPTAALSDSEIDELFKIILQLKKEGVAIIYISHRMEELSHICDRVTVMRDGECIKTLKYTETNTNELIKLMVGRNLNEQYPRVNCERKEKILEVRNLSKKNVLKNINFEVYGGEIVGFAGLVGAGRTELARAIFGADKYDSGEILVNNKKVNIRNPYDAINYGIGYLSEDRKKDGLALNLSVKDNISLASINNFINGLFINDEKENKNAKEYIKNLNIKVPSIKQKCKYLSGGNQQKVVLAKWLCINNLKVIIFDEPTRGIDVGAKVEVYNLMNQLKQKGLSIIMISSDLPEILGISDRIIVMHEGEITGEVKREEATQEKILSYAMKELTV